MFTLILISFILNLNGQKPNFTPFGEGIPFGLAEFGTKHKNENLSLTGEFPDSLVAYLGTTPTLDGFISEGEYDDAEKIIGVRGWQSDTSPACKNSADLSVIGWLKHNGSSLFFAFNVTDDILYGFDIDRWLPANNPNANELHLQRGWPFWGDGMEIMMNTAYSWEDDGGCNGDGRSWQICCSINKSILGGLGVGGLSYGLPYDEEVWDLL